MNNLVFSLTIRPVPQQKACTTHNIACLIQHRALAGHCYRHEELSANKVILWDPVHGHQNRGRPTKTYLDTLMADAGVQNIGELKTCMEDRDEWRIRIRARLRPP